MANAADMIRQRRAGYTAIEIAHKNEVSRQYVYTVLRKASKVKAIIKPTDTGFHVTTEDNAAAAIAIRRALTDAGWEVEG